ncbi:MAG: DUF2147 domain-containing protein [Crocinitomicaceae bacterium]|jgi:uncharacterized protein (DUF2147 family)|nr:DUF2147 domain-containing protein [Crocinitomicaceae bacterium]MDG2463987.1 DUF2147 domain-containing protein [Crocinitomicaceae bacterium]
MKKLIVLTLAVMFNIMAFAQSSIGKWVTIDDKTNKKKSIVELYKDGNKLFGKIIYLYPREGREPNAKCDKCTDDRKGEPLVGLQLVRDLTWNGGAWEGGTIVDPETGKIYTCKMWVDSKDPDKLNVRGYIGPFFRTQTWVKVK